MSTVKPEKAVEGGLVADLFQTSIYKRSQGRITRQVTFAALALAVAVGCWALATTLETYDWVQNLATKQLGTTTYVFSSAVGLAVALPLIWVCYRLVNMPKFADFLIGVEAEMNKVSWPSKNELIRASAVVLFTIFLLATVLFTFDVVWAYVFNTLLGIGGGAGSAGAG